MRRTDRECGEQERIFAIMDRSDTIFLAMRNGEWPYCLPLNFARKDNKIYIHSALAGTKLECIRKDNRVAFAVAIDIKIDIEKSTTYYRSVCGNGIANIVEETDEKGMALELIAEKYGAKCSVPAPQKDIRRVAIIRIDIAHIMGKVNQPE